MCAMYVSMGCVCACVCACVCVWGGGGGGALVRWFRSHSKAPKSNLNSKPPPPPPPPPPPISRGLIPRPPSLNSQAQTLPKGVGLGLAVEKPWCSELHFLPHGAGAYSVKYFKFRSGIFDASVHIDYYTVRLSKAWDGRYVHWESRKQAARHYARDYILPKAICLISCSATSFEISDNPRPMWQEMLLRTADPLHMYVRRVWAWDPPPPPPPPPHLNRSHSQGPQISTGLISRLPHLKGSHSKFPLWGCSCGMPGIPEHPQNKQSVTGCQGSMEHLLSTEHKYTRTKHWNRLRYASNYSSDTANQDAREHERMSTTKEHLTSITICW